MKLLGYTDFLESLDEPKSERLRFVEVHLDYSHGQHDFEMGAYMADEKVAYAHYSVYKETLYLKYIETTIKGKGYGRELMEEIIARYGAENIDTGMLTDEGTKMLSKLNSRIGSSRKKAAGLLSLETIDQIKYPLAKKLLMDVVKNGYDRQDWFFLDKSLYKELSELLDINMLLDLSEYIEGSATAKVNSPEKVPAHLVDFLGAISKNI